MLRDGVYESSITGGIIVRWLRQSEGDRTVPFPVRRQQQLEQAPGVKQGFEQQFHHHLGHRGEHLPASYDGGFGGEVPERQT
jgi:hypothetical protein